MDLSVFYAVIGIGVVSLGGFFCTKTKGFGRFTTATLLLILVLIIATLLVLADKVDDKTMINILFATIGFAGGLFTREKDNNA